MASLIALRRFRRNQPPPFSHITLAATAALCALVGIGFCGTCRAQAFSGSLVDAVRITLDNEPGIASGKQRVAASLAAVTSAASAFDTTLNAGLSRTLQNTPVLAAQQPAVGAGISNFSNNYSVGATRKLRSGVSLNPTLSISRSVDAVSNITAPMRGDAALNVVFPLLRGAGTAVNTAAERSAQLELEASQLAYRHSIAAAINRTVAGYWEYLSAQQSLGVQREAVENSEKLLENARRLARADEIPAADVLKYEAGLSRDRQGVINQQQVFNFAANDLLQAMGQRTPESALATPTDGFVDVAPALLKALLTSAAAASVQAAAARNRADVLALQRRQQSAQTLLDAAQNNPSSQLDVRVGLGFSSLVENRSAVAPLAALRGGPGPNANVSLNYSFPVSSALKQAEVAQRSAALQLATIDYNTSLNTLQRNLALQLGQLGELARQRQSALEQVNTRVRISDNERRRYGAGLVTAFELLAAEEQLTQERLSAVVAAKRLAQAITAFRFEAGLLLDAKADIQTVPLGKITSLPTLNEVQLP